MIASLLRPSGCMARLARRATRWALAMLSMAFLLPGHGHAQATFPSRAVTLIVPFAPGGATDLLARSLASALSSTWKVPVLIVNRSGANGIVATVATMNAAADGHTLLLHTTGYIQNASLYKPLPYDPYADLIPVAQVGTQAMALAVGPRSPHQTLQSLLNSLGQPQEAGAYGSFGAGSTGHIFGQLLASTAQFHIQHVPYRGEVPMIPDLMAGRVMFGFVSSGTAVEHASAGTLRILGVSGDSRLAAMPGVPTMTEVGLGGFDLVGWFGLFAPKGTPAAVVERIAADTGSALTLPELASRLQQLVVKPTGLGPKAFGELMRVDAGRWEALIARFNLASKWDPP